MGKVQPEPGSVGGAHEPEEKMRFAQCLLKNGSVSGIPKLVERFSKFSPSPLSMKQFIDFGECFELSIHTVRTLVNTHSVYCVIQCNTRAVCINWSACVLTLFTATHFSHLSIKST